MVEVKADGEPAGAINFFPQIHLKRDLCTPIAVQRSLYTEQTEPQTRKETRIRHSVRVLLTEFTIVLHLLLESAPWSSEEQKSLL